MQNIQKKLEKFLRPRVAIPLLLVVLFVVYIPCLGGGLVSDDLSLFHENEIPRLSLRLFTLPHMDDYYRPLTILTYSVERSIFGDYFLGYHVANICIYLCICVLAYAVARRFGFSEKQSLLAAALFGALPIHVQPVCWISGRGDLLCVAFILSTILLHSRAGAAARAAAILACACAMFCKELGVVTPVLLFCLDRAAGRRPKLAGYIPYAAAAVVFLFLRYLVVGEVGTHYGEGLEHIALVSPLPERFMLGTYYNAWGLFATLVPYKLALFYPKVSPGFWPGFAGTLLWGLAGILVWRLKQRWWLLALVVLLLPSTGIVKTNTLSDRYMLLPSLLVVLGVVTLLSKRRLLRFGLIPVIAYIAISSFYIGDWRGGELPLLRRQLKRYDLHWMHFGCTVRLMGFEGIFTPDAVPQALYHWYHMEELLQRRGKDSTPAMRELRNGIIRIMREERR